MLLSYWHNSAALVDCIHLKLKMKKQKAKIGLKTRQKLTQKMERKNTLCTGEVSQQVQHVVDSAQVNRTIGETKARSN